MRLDQRLVALVLWLMPAIAMAQMQTSNLNHASELHRILWPVGMTLAVLVLWLMAISHRELHH